MKTDRIDRNRQLASEWHGGQWSALYAYGSSGEVTWGLVQEINQILETLDDPTEIRAFYDLRKAAAKKWVIYTTAYIPAWSLAYFISGRDSANPLAEIQAADEWRKTMPPKIKFNRRTTDPIRVFRPPFGDPGRLCVYVEILATQEHLIPEQE
jgi:hypothetical protein